MNAAIKNVFEPNQAWWLRLFTVIDACDTGAFLSLLTADAQFRFGNAATVVGTEAIGVAVGGFFGAIAGCRHQLLGTWSANATVACEGVVTYTRHDRSMVAVPFANVLELRADKISAYRIYIDNSPLFGAPL